MNEESILEELFAKLAPMSDEQREALLESQSMSDPLRRRIEELLAAHDEQDSVLPTEEFVNEHIGESIGNYKLLQQIGEGGFGVVYMAEQTEPVRRKVALKIIKPGMDTRAVIARFEAERQALAMMDHANIAKVHDGGMTENGRPYFVMELVKGVPITEYCDRNQLSTEERLQLFGTVCRAVQHAHQKGIIHRDLKPSNVLVTLADGRPVAKVIDFGIAKATTQRLTEKTLFTAFGQMMGTPQYMSPEQAEMSCLDVDTRSDVYSLGVILYELLTGTTPLEADKLRSAGYAEMQRLIQEDEPPKPSARLSTSGEQLTIIAKHRSLPPEKLMRQIRGDLDWIVMKALEKDRSRRYESPLEMAQDISNYLQHAPVVARPPTITYLATQYFKRHRVAFLVASLVFASLVVGLLGTISQARVARARANELASEISQKDLALKNLASSRYEEAVLAAMNFRVADAEVALESAEKASEGSMSYDIVRALLSQNRGDHEATIRLCDDVIESASASRSERVAARSLLVPATAFSFDWTRSEVVQQELLGELERTSTLEFVRPVDRLMVGHAMTMINPHEATRILGTTQLQNTPAGLYIGAIANLYVAQDLDDYPLLKRTITDFEYAGRLSGNTAPPKAWQLFSLVHAIRLARREGNPDAVERHNKLGRRIADELQTASYSWGDFARWVFYKRAIGDPDQARLAFEDMQVHGNEYAVYLGTESLLPGASNELRQRFNEAMNGGNSEHPIFRIVAAHIAFACREPSTRVRAFVEDMAKESKSIWHTRLAIATLCLVEEPSRIRSLAQAALARTTDFHDMWGGQTCLEFLADGDENKLMESTEGHQLQRGDSHFVLGMYRLAEGRPGEAAGHFRICVDSSVVGTYDYQLAHAYLQRLEANPNWWNITERRLAEEGS